MPHVLDHPAAPADVAAAHFATRLALETDCSDVAETLRTAPTSIRLIDARSGEAYRDGHIPGAISLPHADITADALAAIGTDAVFVTYCWGPHCNGAHKAAARVAALGHQVKEMIGGIHGWQLEGFSLATAEVVR